MTMLARGITVVPDSGTRELAGIVGTMTIITAEGKHFPCRSKSAEMRALLIAAALMFCIGARLYSGP